MAIYRLKIVGVHYAVNPDSFASAEETELMHQRTAERLRELDEKRPRVALVPEPTKGLRTCSTYCLMSSPARRLS